MDSDAGLNSVHLEGPRRQRFRNARNGLLHARGHQTLVAEMGQVSSDQYPITVMENDHQIAQKLDFWLKDQEDWVYPLKVGLNTLGRSSDNDVVVADACVSRRHCAILVHASSVCELHDIASINGTFINGSWLWRPTCLKPGDEIRMGERHFVFHTRHAPAPVEVNTRTLSF